MSKTYSYDNLGWTNVNMSWPEGTDPGSDWDNAIRYIMQVAKDVNGQEHNATGTHKDAFLQASMIDTGVVGYAHCDADLKARIDAAGEGGGGAGLSLLAYKESAFTGITATGGTTGSITVPANSCSLLLIEAEVEISNATANNRWVEAALELNGTQIVSARTVAIHVSDGQHVARLRMSKIVTGGQVSSVALVAKIYTEIDSINLSGTGACLRCWGIP